jgi:hypothetical protein
MHFMVDLETLGTKPGCAIVSVGAVAFDIAGIYDRFYEVTIPAAHMKIEYDTVRWWMERSVAARKIFDMGSNPIPIAGALMKLRSFILGGSVMQGMALSPIIEGVWSHGSIFDLVILEEAYQLMGGEAPWDFRQVRDTRTLYVFFDKKLPKNTHNALEDAEAQAKLVIQIMCEQKARNVLDHARDDGSSL